MGMGMDSLRISERRLYNRVPPLSNENRLLAGSSLPVYPGSNAFTGGKPMKQAVRPIGKSKRIALVAHDNKKKDLLEWAEFNKGSLSGHTLYATGTTGALLEKELGLEIIRLQSGPLGGDQQIGARIADGEIDFLIFFWDPLQPMSHDTDVKALLRIAVVWNIPVACDRATADFIISSPLMHEEYDRILPDYEGYRRRLEQSADAARKR
jgi:methylglyoxal synthase